MMNMHSFSRTWIDCSHHIYDTFPSNVPCFLPDGAQGPADDARGLEMMGYDDLDILTDVHQWIERDDIAEITEDMDVGEEEPSTGLTMLWLFDAHSNLIL